MAIGGGGGAQKSFPATCGERDELSRYSGERTRLTSFVSGVASLRDSCTSGLGSPAALPGVTVGSDDAGLRRSDPGTWVNGSGSLLMMSDVYRDDEQYDNSNVCR